MRRGVQHTALIDGRLLSFGDAEWALFITLFNARGAGFSYRDLIAKAFEHFPCGGSEDISVSLHYLRRKLLVTRFRIPARPGARWQAVGLVRLPAPAHSAHALTDATAALRSEP